MPTTRTFQRSPRMRPEIPTGEEELKGPDAMPAKPSSSLSSRMEDVVFTGGASVVGAGLMAAITHSGLSMIIGGITMFGFGVLRGVVGYKREMKSYNAGLQSRAEKNDEYLAQKRKGWEELAARQREALVAKDPDPEECLGRAERVDVRLFERAPADNDFLTPRIGAGPAPFAIKIKAPAAEGGDEVMRKTAAFAHEFAALRDAPVCAPLRRLGVAGVVGQRFDTMNLLRCLMMQLATHHASSEVKIILVHPEEEDWAWARWLPHVWSDDWRARFIATQKAQVSALFEELGDVLKRRQNKAKEDDKQLPLPIFVFVIASETLVAGEPLIELLLQGGPQLGALGLFVRDTVKELPKGCHTIIEAGTGTGKLIVTGETTVETSFTPDEIDTAHAERFARALAPLRVAASGGSADIPGSLTLLDLLGVKSIEEMDVVGTWMGHEPYKSMSIPIGVQAGGKVLEHNLHEKGHGPHGLVAGTTGSGKTVFLSTYLTTLATWFHPHEVAFVAVDYKGGDLYRGLEELPHLVATLTNLEKSQVWRSLRALKAENERRMRLFNKASQENGVSINKIDEYQVLARQGKAEPLPKLLIMCDEFAELSKQEPEFIGQIVSIARVGRSLGVHLVLATQNPAGIISEQIESNTRFRIAFKFNKDEDSKAVIKRPEAATIRQSGRGYFQLGENEMFELFQSGFGGAEYDAAASAASEQPVVAQVLINGARRVLGQTKSSGAEGSKKPTQMQALAKKIADAAAAAGIKRLPGPWLEPLPNTLTLDAVQPKGGWNGASWDPTPGWLTPAIGLLDDPAHTYQGPLLIDLPRDGHLSVFGKPGAGNTTVLMTLIMSLARAHSPDDVTFYLLDCGGQLLTKFKRLPHVGEVVLSDDADRTVRLLRFLLRRMRMRKQLLGKAGVSTLASYRQSTGEKVPAVVLVIDNYVRFSKDYPDSEEILATIVQEGANLGFYVVFTANGPSVVKQKIAGNVSNAVSLQLADRTEYNVAVGRAENLEPAALPGRGLVKGKPPLEYQTALPVAGETDVERNAALEATITAMDAAWKGARPDPVPVVPPLIRLDELVAQASPGGLSVPLGYDVDEVQPFMLAPADGPHFIVTGPMQSGKTKFLTSFAVALASLVEPNRLTLTIVDLRDGHLQPLARLPHVRAYVDSDDKLTNALSELKDAQNQRKEALRQAREAAGGVLDDNEFLATLPVDVVLLDDFEQMREQSGAVNQEDLIALIKSSRGPGLHFVMVGEVNDMGANGFDGMMRAMSGFKTGLLLGTRDDNGIFGNVRIPPEQTTFAPGEGYFIQRGGVRNRFKLARPDAEAGALLGMIDRICERFTQKIS